MRPSPLLMALLVAAALLAGPTSAREPGPPADASAAQREIRALRQEIAARELFAALALSDAQETALAALIVDVEAERAEHRAEREQNAPAVAAALRGYLAELKRDGAPKPATVERLRTLREERRGDREDAREEHRDRREQLRELLSEEQRAVIAEFRPMGGALPDPEEQEHARDARPEEAGARGKERGRDEGATRERMDRRDDQRAHAQARRVVERVLLSAEMLALLR